MKSLFIVLVLVFIASSKEVEIEMKGGDLEIGEPICQSKGKLTLKVGSSTVEVFKKSLRRVGDIEVEGKREFMVHDSLFLKDKNEVSFINSSGDSAVIKLRRPDHSIVNEQNLSGDGSVIFDVPDGSYYETVKFFRGNKVYFTKGSIFVVESKCTSFAKVDIDLRGYPVENPPLLTSSQKAFERE